MNALTKKIGLGLIAVGAWAAQAQGSSPSDDGFYRGGNRVLHPLSCEATGAELAEVVPGANAVQVYYGHQGHTWTVFPDSPAEKAGGWDQSSVLVQFLRIQGGGHEVLRQYRYLGKTVNEGVENRTGKSTGQVLVRDLTKMERETVDLDARTIRNLVPDSASLLTLPLEIGREEYSVRLDLSREGLGQIPVSCEVIW